MLHTRQSPLRACKVTVWPQPVFMLYFFADTPLANLDVVLGAGVLAPLNHTTDVKGTI
jgi:hypothetical protein